MSQGDWSRWNRLRAAAREPTVFADPRFAETISETLGYPIRAFAVFEEQSETPDAGILLYEGRTGPFRTGVLPPFCPHTPLLLRRAYSEADAHYRRTPLAPLLRLLAESFDAVRIDLPPEYGDVRPFRWAGWETSPLYTYRAPLGPAADRLETWSGSTRRTYQNERGRYELMREEVTPARLVELCASSYERHHRSLPGPGEEVLTRTVTRLCAHEIARVYGLRSRATGAVEAAAALLLGPGRAYYWIGGSRPGAAMTVLLGHLITADLGAREEIDLMGANTPSVAEFKRKFGATLTPYYRAESTPSPLLRLARSMRRTLARGLLSGSSEANGS